VDRMGISGKKALLQCWREEAKQGLRGISEEEYNFWQSWSAPIPVIFRATGALASLAHPNYLPE